MNNQPGFIQVVILPNPVIDVPTPYQVLQGTNAYNNPMMHGTAYYDGMNLINLTLTGGFQLDTVYTMCFVGTSIDMSDCRQSTQSIQKQFGIPYVIYINNGSIQSIGNIFFLLLMFILVNIS